MADPAAALLTQLKNIQAKTGQSIAALQAAIAATGLAKVGEKRTWAMEHFKLGHGDANTVVLMMGKPLPDLAAPAGTATLPVPEGDPLDSIYSGAKAHLRPVHEAAITAFQALGAFELAPKKAYVSLRRKKQFAMLGPATKDQLELGLNVKELPAHARLKALPAGGMCNYSLRFGSAAEIDAALLAWVRAAYDAAG
jgi:Domain of unknown function (DUF5655)/Domain of unknown function (DUF4287)